MTDNIGGFKLPPELADQLLDAHREGRAIFYQWPTSVFADPRAFDFYNLRYPLLDKLLAHDYEIIDDQKAGGL